MKSKLTAFWAIYQVVLRNSVICLIAFGGLIASENRVAWADNKAVNDPARHLFTQHCQKCHGGIKPKGDFQIGSLSPDFADRKNAKSG